MNDMFNNLTITKIPITAKTRKLIDRDRNKIDFGFSENGVDNPIKFSSGGYTIENSDLIPMFGSNLEVEFMDMLIANVRGPY